MTNDSALKEAVLAELAWEPSVTAAHIGVTARDGVVTLSGHVLASYEKHAAEAAARRVKGVKAVAEEIEVKLSLSLMRDDGDIAAAAVSRLAWDASIPENAIKVTVEKGWVKLTGRVDSWSDRKLAGATAWAAPGATSVENDLVIA